MKLRIYRDSLRFRLSPSDVANLLQRGRIKEITYFAVENQLSYELQIRSSAAMMRATFESNCIFVQIPRTVAKDWAESDAIGISHSQDAGHGKRLEILIEKDFECLEDPVTESEEVLYPNPKKTCQ